MKPTSQDFSLPERESPWELGLFRRANNSAIQLAHEGTLERDQVNFVFPLSYLTKLYNAVYLHFAPLFPYVNCAIARDFSLLCCRDVDITRHSTK